jgi:hypothetical protein
MSSLRQAVIFGPSFTGEGYRPDLTPAHHVDLDTGIGPPGAMIALRRLSSVLRYGMLSLLRGEFREGMKARFGAR